MIVRVWRGITSLDQAADYLQHLRETALPAVQDVKGLQNTWVLQREQGEKCEFQLITLWDTVESMRAWAGGDPEKAVYFAQDDRFLLDMEPLVRLYDVVDTVPPLASA